jgi:hypothetical protein
MKERRVEEERGKERERDSIPSLTAAATQTKK